MVLTNGQMGSSMLWNGIQALITEKESEKSPSVKQYLSMGTYVNLIVCPLFTLEYKLVLIEIIQHVKCCVKICRIKNVFLGVGGYLFLFKSLFCLGSYLP